MRFGWLLLFVSVLSCTTSHRTKRRARSAEGKPSSGMVTEEQVAGLGDPDVLVSNADANPIVVELVGATSVRFTVPPHESRDVRVVAGSYTLRVSGPGFPDERVVELKRDHRYVIGTRAVLEVDDPRFASVGFYCYEVQLQPFFLNCARRAEDCAGSRAERAAKFPTTACAYEANVSFIRIEDTPGSLPFVMFTRDAQQCETVRADWVSRHPSHHVGTCERRP